MQGHQEENKTSTEKTDEDKKKQEKRLGARDLCDHLERQQIITTV